MSSINKYHRKYIKTLHTEHKISKTISSPYENTQEDGIKTVQPIKMQTLNSEQNSLFNKTAMFFRWFAL